MKKIIAFLVSIVFVLCELNVVSVALYDETDSVSLGRFTSAFVDMVAQAEQESDKGVISESADIYFSNATNNVENNDISTGETTVSSNRLLVKASVKLDPLDSVGYVYGYNNLHILQFDNRTSLEKAYEYYSSLKYVEYVEEDLYLTEAAVDEEDVVFESGLDCPTIVQSNLFGYTSAKLDSDGYNVDVAVIDSGVQHDHEFFQGRVINTGFNSISDNNSAYDDRGHGTHVAGIIVSNTLSNVTVYAYKALNKVGSGTAAQVSLAIDAAIEDGMDIINLSVQMQGYSDTLHEAVQRAYSAGITVVAAAGNAGVDIEQTPYSPGCFEEVISVMSCSDTRRLSDFSNYGTPCDFAAPGEDVLSTYLNDTYKISSGTSMASPFICAAVVYELAKNNSMTPDEVKAALLDKSEVCYGTPKGLCVYPASKISLQGYTNKPTFEFNSCMFAGSLRVGISCPTENSDIFYSVNNELYKKYTEPFYITETTSVSAFAISSIFNVSETKAVKYNCVSDFEDEFVLNDDDILVFYNGTKTDLYVPSVINSKYLSGISNSVFQNNTTIKTITFESNLTHIPDDSFKGCTSLQWIIAPDVVHIGNDAFNGCTSLVNVNVNNLGVVGDRAFLNCSSLTGINTQTTKYFGVDAFKGCSSLTSFNSDVLTEFDLSYLGDCVNIRFLTLSNITNLPDLYEGESLDDYFPLIESFNAPFVTRVPANYFKNCSKLVSVNFKYAFSIDDYAFYGASLLTSIDAIDIKTIGKYAFSGTKLISAIFGNVTSIGEGAFYDCQSIKEVSLSALKTMGEKAFYNCTSNETVALPKIETIPYRAFYNNTSLTKVTFTTLCKTIKYEAFMNCTSLTTFDLGKSGAELTLEDRAFYGCSSYVPSSMTAVVSIGKNVFTNTKGTEIKKLNLNKLTYADVDSFNGLNVKTLILPKVVTLYDVPSNCRVLIGSSAKSLSIPNNKSTIIYSYQNSTVSSFCINNNIEHIEFNALSAIIKQPHVTNPYTYELEFDVLGFSNVYTLYGSNMNTDMSLNPGNAIKITNFSQSGDIVRLHTNNYKYYFFVITCKGIDGVTLFSSFRTPYFSINSDVSGDSTIKKNWDVEDSENNTFYEPKFKNGEVIGNFFSTKYTSFDQAREKIYVTNGSMKLSPSMCFGEYSMYGTGTIFSFYDIAGAFVAAVPFILYGDVNGDGAIDALDCAEMTDCIYERENFDNDCYWLAADYNEDGILNVVDFQLIVNNSVL